MSTEAAERYTLTFQALAEASPGPRWQALFERHWPGYMAWFLSEGEAARPTWLTAREQFARYMPELVGTYEQLCALAGGGDLEARFLSLYRPPPYLAGCSQAVWPGEEPLLVRNYDYAPALCEGVLLMSTWNGRRVIAMSDSLWGVLDGMNEDGLVVSLTFGGRRQVGDGFGVPILLRYVLETCRDVGEAVAALLRVPTHMSYNVTVLDATGAFRTLYLAPDRALVVRQIPVAANHQSRIEWYQHARATRSFERERFLFARLADSDGTPEDLLAAFAHPPLYSPHYRRGFGTLYTAIYRPTARTMEFRWPAFRWQQSFDDFREGTHTVRYGSGERAQAGAPLDA